MVVLQKKKGQKAKTQA